MVKFNELCRKDCPWLILNEDDVPNGLPGSCTAFNEYIKAGVEGAYKCEACKKVTKVTNKDVSIDSLVHTVSILTHTNSVMCKHLKANHDELRGLKETLSYINSGIKKSNLKELIKNDPSGGN